MVSNNLSKYAWDLIRKIYKELWQDMYDAMHDVDVYYLILEFY